MQTETHSTKITGSKAIGFQAECSCGWMHLGTYVPNREAMKREVAEHAILSERGDLFRALDAGAIIFEEWKTQTAQVEVRLAELLHA